MANPHWQFQSDDDEEALTGPSRVRKKEPKNGGRRKRLKLMNEDDEEEEVGEKECTELGHGTTGDHGKDENAEVVKPIGESIRVSGNDRTRRVHFKSFEYDGVTCKLEDHVLIVPDTHLENPYVATIKDIFQTLDGHVMVNVQWFFWPKVAEKEAGLNWQSRDPRELFFSFHRDEIPAQSVMHKCVVHFIPPNKPIPGQKQHPGFIVHNVYDTKEKKLFELTDKSYEYSEQHEIDLLILNTMYQLGELPDAEMLERASKHEERNKGLLMKRNMVPRAVPKNDERTTRCDPHLKPETPVSVTSSEAEYYDILSRFKALTGETQRDKWLVKHLQGIQIIWSPKDSEGVNVTNGIRLKIEGDSGDKNNAVTFQWPDVAVSAVTALEKAAHDAHSSDFMKYNQKMRQLLYNLKINTVLAQRMLKGELEFSKIVKMSSYELKHGLTSEELAIKEPEKAEHIQMTDARCKRCKEKQVAMKYIIAAGHGDRYQLECLGCGNTWYGSQNEAISLSIVKESTDAKIVGTVPLATSKFEDVEKAAYKSGVDIFRNSTIACIPVMDRQKKTICRK